MCNYIYKEMFCEHFVFLVDEWCENYIITQKRCPPKVIGKEYWGSDLCPHCIEKQKPNTHPCAKLIEHIQRRSSPPFRRFDATYYHEYHHSTGRVVTRVLTPWDYQSKSRNNNNNNRHYHPYARPSSSRGGISKRGSSSSSSSSSRAYPLYCVSPQHAAFDRMP